MGLSDAHRNEDTAVPRFIMGSGAKAPTSDSCTIAKSNAQACISEIEISVDCGLQKLSGDKPVAGGARLFFEPAG